MLVLDKDTEIEKTLKDSQDLQSKFINNIISKELEAIDKEIFMGLKELGVDIESDIEGIQVQMDALKIRIVREVEEPYLGKVTDNGIERKEVIKFYYRDKLVKVRPILFVIDVKKEK